MNTVVIHKSNKLTFYIYPKTIVICTNFQCFRVYYLQPSGKKYLRRLVNDIIEDKIKNVIDLADYNNGNMLLWCNTSIPTDVIIE